MAFALSSKETLNESLERVATSEIDTLLQFCQQAPDTEEPVHETRKSIKRLRALLRLYQGALAPSVFEREDDALRTLAQSLGQARDAVALRESLERLVLAAPAATRAHLADHVAALRAVLGRDSSPPVAVNAALASAHDGLAAFGARAAQWVVDRNGWSAIAPGLRRTYARGRRALGRAARRPSEKRLHELRRWVKRHQYQLTLLEPLWPGPLKAFRQEAQELGELLGQDHDLSLLERRFDALGEHPDFTQLEPSFRAAAEAHHAELRRQASDLGARLYAEAPGRFAARYRDYFDARP